MEVICARTVPCAAQLGDLGDVEALERKHSDLALRRGQPPFRELRLDHLGQSA